MCREERCLPIIGLGTLLVLFPNFYLKSNTKAHFLLKLAVSLTFWGLKKSF